MIGAAAGWKFNHMPGISSKGGVLTAFPSGVPGVTYGPDGLPIQSEQDQWVIDYQAYRTDQDALEQSIKDKVRDEKGQEGGLTFTNERIDNLIDRLRHLGVKLIVN